MSDQHALWPYGPNHPKTRENLRFWQNQSQLPPEASIARTENWGQGRPQQHTTIAHPDHPLMGGPGFGTGGPPGPLPPLPDNNAKGWLQDLLFRSTGNAGGNTLAQDLIGGNVGAGSSSAALGFLKGVGNKLKDLWNRPIMAPTITKDEHDRLIRGEGGGEKNWQNTPQY
jgi:hypothetical protein